MNKMIRKYKKLTKKLRHHLKEWEEADRSLGRAYAMEDRGELSSWSFDNALMEYGNGIIYHTEKVEDICSKLGRLRPLKKVNQPKKAVFDD